MNNFTYSIPTVIHFGRNQLEKLAGPEWNGKTVLLVYGGGSIRRSGLYDRVCALISGCGGNIVPLGGVEPNPRIESVREGVRLCREHAVDAVLAVGGGSVIDCAKVIAAGAVYDGDPWELVLDEKKVQSALPVYSVLTLAATGSEMDCAAVISDMTKNEKLCTSSPLLRPMASVLDPTNTFSVPAQQTASGSADIFSHTLENYFSPVRGAYLQFRLGEAILKTVIRFAPAALRTPDDYTARANLMWASSLAINGLLDGGAEVGWSVHSMEHELSAFYDITHGVGLAILTPYWMEFALREDTAWKFAEYGRNVFGISEENELAAGRYAIACTREFFASLGLPATLREVGIGSEHFEEMAEHAAACIHNSFVPLTKDDIRSIYEHALGGEANV